MKNREVDNLTDLLKSAKSEIDDLNAKLGGVRTELDYSYSQRESLSLILANEQERCLGWQEHAKRLARTLEVISEFQNSLMKQAVIDNG